MNEQDFHTVEMMEKYGGSFVKALAELAHRADHINLQKIKETWPEYWKQYSEMGKPRRTIQMEEEHKPHQCSDPELKGHCSGCTDPRSEGTHQGCTIEHGHVGCHLALGREGF